MDSNYIPPSAEPPFNPDDYTPPSAEPPVDANPVTPPASEPEIIDVTAKETPPAAATSGFDAVPEGLASQAAKPQYGGAVPPPPAAPIPPAKSGGSNTSRTVWIILAVVLVVLCCCCLLALGIGTWLWNNGDSILNRFSSSLPGIAAWFA